MGAWTSTRARFVGQVLLERGQLTQGQLDEALAVQRSASTRKLLGEVLVEHGFCTELQVLEALAEVNDIPFARITSQLADASVATLLPRDFEEDNLALPLYRVDGVLTVALAEPANLFLVEEIAQMTGLEVQIVASPRADILAAIEGLHRYGTADRRAINDILAAAEDIRQAGTTDGPDLASLQEASSDSPVVKLVHQMIVSAVRERASDVHVEPGDQVLRIRFRVDGRLYEKMKPPHAMAPALASRVKVLAGLDIAERRLPQDGAIRVTIDDRPIDLRISTLPNRFGEKVVLRILDAQNALLGLEKLGMEPGIREAFTRAILKPHGMVLVTGPTGSGKSTTLYSALSAIVSEQTNICTVEDPIEYNLPGINQFQVRERIGLTFPELLRSLLRQDPDVIMVGEIRDPDTCCIAVQAALTGHLVLSTLHTNDAPSTLPRLINLGAEPFLVSASLEAILAQRLVRKVCRHCRVAIEPTPHLRSALGSRGIAVERIFHGRGCADCRQTGCAGRVGLYELLIPNDEIRSAIAEDAPVTRLRRLAAAAGMTPLAEAGLAKARDGETTYEEILRVYSA